MANRYNRANPAKDTYFNSFVPLPLDQLTALGMSKKQDLEKNQALLDKAYNDALDIKYIKESPAEESNYRALQKGMTDLALKYSTVDLTNPIEMSNMRRELRSVADPTLIKRMEESFANRQQYKALEMDMRAKGTWNDYLNKSKASKHDSKTGLYNELPEAYLGRKATFGQYFDNLPVDFKGIEKRNGMPFMIHGVREEDVNAIANQRAAEIAMTPGGQQEVRIYREMYGDVAKKMTDDQVINLIARDYAQKEIHDQASAVPEYMAKAFSNNQAQPSSLPLVNMSGATDHLSGSYKKDLQRANDLTSQVKLLDQEIAAAKDEDTKLKIGAIKNELLNEKKQIESAAEQVRASNDPEYQKSKSTIMDDFYRKTKLMGLDQAQADSLFEDIKKEGDSSTWLARTAQTVFTERPTRFAKAERQRLLETPMRWAKGSLSGMMGTLKNIMAKDPDLAGSEEAMNMAMNMAIDKIDMFGRVSGHEFTTARIAMDAFDKLRKLDKRTDRKIADEYDKKVVKSEQDLGFILPGSSVSTDSNDLTTTKDGLQKIRATSALLKDFKMKGGQNANVIDVSPVDKAKNYMTDVKDIKNYILSSDNLTLGAVAPATKSDGTYSFSINASKSLGSGKGTETKNFKVSFNDATGPEASSWKAAIYDDLIDQGHTTEAYRIIDDRLETEIKAKQNDKEIVVSPDRSNPNIKFRFVNNLDGTYDQVNTKTGQSIPSNTDLQLQEIIQLLYDYKVATLKK